MDFEQVEIQIFEIFTKEFHPDAKFRIVNSWK
jgi:hypothetical protein